MLGFYAVLTFTDLLICLAVIWNIPAGRSLDSRSSRLCRYF